METPKKLLNKNYYLLWQGQTVSRIGTHIFSAAMILWIIDYTDKASLLGLIGMLAGIPEVLISPIGGTLADRFSRRTIIITSDFLNGILKISLAAVFFFFSGSVQVVIIAILIITPLSSAINSFFYPAISASIPDLVPEEKLNAANSLSQSTGHLTNILGQMLGSSLYFLLGTPMLVLINGFSYMFSSASEFFVKIPQKISNEQHNVKEHVKIFKKDIVVGLKYIWQKKGLKNLVLISAVLNFFTVPIILLFPYYLEKILHINKAWYPYFLAVYLAGMLLGFLLASLNIATPKLKNKLIFAFIILDASIYGIMGLNRNVYLAIFLILSSGIMSGFVQIIITSVLQTTTPSQMRGRIFGFIGTLGSSLSPVAMGLAGLIADLTNKNIPLIYISCSILMITLALVVWADKNVREFLAFKNEEIPVDNKIPESPSINKNEILTNN